MCQDISKICCYGNTKSRIATESFETEKHDYDMSQSKNLNHSEMRGL